MRAEFGGIAAGIQELVKIWHGGIKCPTPARRASFAALNIFMFPL
jgi:hypothetical protein